MKKYVTLGEICKSRSSNIMQKDIACSQGSYAIYGASGYIKNIDFYHLEDPYIAVVKDGAGVGRLMLLPEKTSVIGTMQYIIPDASIDMEYLYYAMMAMNLSKYATGSTIPHIYFRDYQKEKLPLPLPEEQRRIAAIFHDITHAIDLCNAILDKLDLLIKSRFIEMFGDPETNPYNFSKVNMAQIISDKICNGFFAKRKEYCMDGNISVLGVANVVNRMYSNIKNLPKTNGTISDIKKYSVKYGDMLFCRSSLVAEGIGKASIVPKNVPNNILFECHVIRVPLDLNKCNPEFMQVQSTTNSFRSQIISKSKTATMTTISQDGILKTNIILPPLELQTQFAEFVQSVDKSKLKVKQVLEKTETLKKSLMQKYFA